MAWIVLPKETFLSTYVRGTPPSLNSDVWKTFNGVFDGVGKASEYDMYLGLTCGFNSLLTASKCSGFRAVHTGALYDTSIQGTAEDKDLNKLRPDISIVPNQDAALQALGSLEAAGEDSTEAPPSSGGLSAAASTLRQTMKEKEKRKKDLANVSARTSWAWAELVIEVKHKNSRGWPFGDGSSRSKDLLSGDLHEESRAQLIEYGSEVFRRQHRRFVFIVSIYGDNARLLYLDRSGAIVSEPFNYRQNARIMGEFFYRLFGPGTVSADRGHDPTAVLATEAEAATFRALPANRTLALNDIERAALERAATPGWLICRLKITSPWSPLQPSADTSTPGTYTRAVRADDAEVTRDCLVGRPAFSRRSMLSRGTKVFVGYDIEARVPVVIKESWRSYAGEGDRTELKTYHELWKDDPSQAKGETEGLLTPLGGGDVIEYDGSSDDAAKRVQRTATVPTDLAARSERSARVHVRLVLKEVCTPLSSFEDSFVLVLAIYYALLAHMYAWTRHRILHSDVSAGNILIWYNKDKTDIIGKLADWDMAKSEDELNNETAATPWRSGTWQFMSAILTRATNKVHTPSDDFESIMHVLSWMVLKYLENGCSWDTIVLARRLTSRFDDFVIIMGPNGEERHGAAEDKFRDVVEGRPLAELSRHFHHYPLAILLLDLANLCKQHYAIVMPRLMSAPEAPTSGDEPEYSARQSNYLRKRSFRVTNTLMLSKPIAPSLSLAAQISVPSRTVNAQDVAVDEVQSPLHTHEDIIQVFEKCLDIAPWPIVPRQVYPAASTVSTTSCSLPPASSVYAGDKHPAETLSGPDPKRFKQDT